MRRISILSVLAVTTVAAAGCGGGGGSGSGSGSVRPGTAAAPTLEVKTMGGLPSSYSIRADVKDAPVQVLDVVASGAAITVKSLTITGAGSIDDLVDVGGVKIAIDDGDGRFDKAKDRFVGGIARYNKDNGVAIVGGINHTVQPGAAELWWVVYDLAGTADPGETLAADVVAAADVDALDAAGRPATVIGTPAASPQGVVFIAEHLMLSEVCVTPTNGEFFEIFNPTAQTVDLSNTYATDAQNNTPTAQAHYYNLPTGRNFGPWNETDFHVRFPAGATIRPGQFLTVALDAAKFQSNYGKMPDFEMVQNGAGNGVPDMRIVGPTPPTWTAGFSNTAEIVVLYTWDGNSDLVQDVDMVQWGTAINTFYVDKSSASIDGPDQDSIPTAYRADSSMMMQDKAQANTIGTSMKRVDFTEYGEVATGGNGVAGHDETSENYGITWSAMTSPTPGAK